MNNIKIINKFTGEVYLDADSPTYFDNQSLEEFAINYSVIFDCSISVVVNEKTKFDINKET